MTQSTYSTPDEVTALVEAAYQAGARLPCAFQDEMNPLATARDGFLGVVRSLNLVDPADAAGTDHYRRVHGLPTLTTPTERSITHD